MGSRDLTISTIRTSLTTYRLLEFGMQDEVSGFRGDMFLFPDT
jgi:hypothetical protein